MDPNGDDAVAWTRSAGDSNFECVDDAVRQPADPGTADYVSTTDNLQSDDYTLTAAPSGTATGVKVWLYGSGGDNVKCSVDFDPGDGGGWEGNQENIIPHDGGLDWYSATFNGAWTQGNLDSAKMRIRSDTDGDPVLYVYAAYVEIL